MPIMSDSKTWTEVHENWRPPQVKAKVSAAEPPTITPPPLNDMNECDLDKGHLEYLHPVNSANLRQER